MTSMIPRNLWPVLFAMLFACLAWAAPGQGYGQGQQNPPKPPAAPTPSNQPAQTAPAQPEAPPVNKEEEDAYKALFETKGDPNHKVQLGEGFLKKFPQSRYRESVYSQLASAYLSLGQEDKMFAAGEKALEMNSSDVDVLALLAWVMPRRIGGNALDADQKLDKSEKYGKQAIVLLAAFQKPPGLSDEDFNKAKNEKLSMCHSGLGIVYFHRQKYADSASELEQATKLAANPDPTDFYILGIAYMNAKRFGDAAGAFGHCGEMAWSWQDRCKQELAIAKKQAATQLSAPK